mgnify:CR=1 FL=1
MEINFFAPVAHILAVLPAMRAQGGGTIVMVSSIAGRVAFPGQGHYAASKHALEAASEILAQEVGAAADEIVWFSNVTVALNAVARSLRVSHARRAGTR